MNDKFHTELSKKIYWFYPKYETLFEPTRIAFWSVQTNKIDVYIDASNFIESLIKPTVEFDDDMAIVAGLVNLAIHFRRFYLKHFNTYSRIFIVYSDRTSFFNKALIPEYDSVYSNLFSTLNTYKVNKLNINLSLLSEVCKYLQDIYFIQTNIEPAVKIRSLITEHSKNVPVALFSKDPFMCQVPAVTPNAIMFKLTKHPNIPERVDTIGFNNAILYYMSLHRRTLDAEKIKKISPYLYSTVLTLTNCKERNIVLAMSVNKAISMLSDAIKNVNIHNTYPDIISLYKNLQLYQHIDQTQFFNRFKALDIIYQQGQYDLMPDARSTSWKIDITNNDALKEINDKYFIKTPLNINDL